MKTPKEIKKALEFCNYEDYCYDCAYLDECVNEGNSSTQGAKTERREQ